MTGRSSVLRVPPLPGMAFRAERKFNLLILEEGEEYVSDFSVSMSLLILRKGKAAESKGRLRIGSKSLLFQPDEVSESILKFPYRKTRSIGDAREGSFPIECDEFVQVATKMTGGKTRIVAPFSVQKTQISAHFRVHYGQTEEYLKMMRQLWEASSLSYSDAEVVVKGILDEANKAVQFDMSRLGHRESALLQQHLWVRRVKPLLQVRGMLQISNEAIYFQPHPNFASEPVQRVPLAEVLHVFCRIYGVQANALEIITTHGRCLYLCFEAHGECEQVAAILQRQRQDFTVRSGAGGPRGMASLRGSQSQGDAEDVLQDIHWMTARWQSGLLSNFHYLDFLNCAAGRSQNDFSQYPVFPWVLKDYTSASFDPKDPTVYRDLTKPIGALNAKRLNYFKERMAGMPDEDRFLYGTHYSTPAYVIYWLLRSMPERMLRLHSGHFDADARLFRSVLASWEAVNESTASLMELIPEFFTLPCGWLENDLGITTAEGVLKHVELPRWARDVTDFICKMRAALESEQVSRHLPAWIDLIFGSKQQGEEAVKADNLFHPVCYTSSGGRQQPSSSLNQAVLETQLQEFGRVPRQLFLEAHPPRLKVPRWDVERLRTDPTQSEPWYKVVRHISEGEGVTESPSSASPAASAQPPSAMPTAGQGSGSASDMPEVVTAGAMQALAPMAASPLTASGRITGVASCRENMYCIGEDGCLRVAPLPVWGARRSEDVRQEVMRRNFRISPMPLSALAVLRTDIAVIGGHDNAVTLYSSSCGSALARCNEHADTVTCLSVSPGGQALVSGSRDQSVRTWALTPSSLRSDAAFDDCQQPVTCAATGRSLVLAGGADGQLVAWDIRSGNVVLDRELGGSAVACALHRDERLAVALDETGELRLWDLRHSCETLRLPLVQRSGGSLATACCLLTDFAGWAVVGGAGEAGGPTVALWDIPEQREIRSWQLDRSGEVQFLVQASGAGEDVGRGGPFLTATASGAVHAFAPPR